MGYAVSAGCVAGRFQTYEHGKSAWKAVRTKRIGLYAFLSIALRNILNAKIYEMQKSKEPKDRYQKDQGS